MSISKSFNKKTGVTYVYEVYANYWDKDLKKQVTKRRCIGKIDPATGDIIPNRKKKEADQQPPVPSNPVQSDKPSSIPLPIQEDKIFLQNLIPALDTQISSLEVALESLKTQREQARSLLSRLKS